MKNFLGSTTIIFLLAGAIVFLSAVFIVSETEQVVITQFGEPKGDPIQEPGLYFKIPGIQEANYFDKRILEWDGDANRVPTKDKRYIWIDTTARWRIVDPLKFLQTVRNEDGAQQQLDNILDGRTRNVIAGKTLIEIVRSSNRILDVEASVDAAEQDQRQEFEPIPEDSGRDSIRTEILRVAQPKIRAYGIELVDILIKRLNYEQDVQKKVFERMISERKRVADKYRSEGESERARIEGLKEREIKRIRSEAYREAEVLRGKADAEAIKIYADAYNNDPEFYSFVRTLESYRETLTDGTTLILGTNNEYLDYLKEIRGGK